MFVDPPDHLGEEPADGDALYYTIFIERRRNRVGYGDPLDRCRFKPLQGLIGEDAVGEGGVDLRRALLL